MSSSRPVQSDSRQFSCLEVSERGECVVPLRLDRATIATIANAIARRKVRPTPSIPANPAEICHPAPNTSAGR